MAAQAVVKAVEEAIKKTVEKIVEKITQKVAEKAAEKAVEQVAEKAAEKTAEQVAEKVGEQAVEQTVEQVGQQTVTQTAQTGVEAGMESAGQGAANANETPDLGNEPTTQEAPQAPQGDSATTNDELSKSNNADKNKDLVADQMNMKGGDKEALQKFKDGKDNVDRLSSSIGDACDGVAKTEKGLENGDYRAIMTGAKKFFVDAPVGAAKSFGGKGAQNKMNEMKGKGVGVDMNDLLEGREQQSQDKEERNR